MKNIFLILLASTIMLSGCQTVPILNPPTEKTNSLSTVHALIVGMEMSNIAGPCPGSALDAQTFNKICADKNINSTTFISGQATHKNITKALKELCETYETAIFYYSGHGGRRVRQYGGVYDGPVESDGADEYLCLYDKAMLDDSIWDIISKAKGRVICIFDCCHSATMYRAPMFKKEIKFGAPIITNFVDAVNIGGIFVLAGSPDTDYSYGSAQGGQLTNAIKRHYKNKTYASLFDILENDKILRKYQKPICTIINGFDADIEFLK